jgi:hypothetical protein
MSDGAYLVERIRRNSTECGDCLLWTGYCNNGIMPVINIDRKPTAVRRAMWEATHGTVKDGHEVVHTCESRKCVAVEHLETITKGERRKRMALVRNTQQSASAVRIMRERFSKLTMEKAREIRASDEQGKVLAERYGVTPQLVSLVRTGKSWAEPSPWAGLGAR